MTDWTFTGFGDEFDDHAVKHLPHYDTAHDVICHVASYALADGGILADLGCSTGRAVERVARALPHRHFTAHLYDLDRSMLDRADERLADVDTVTRLVHRTDITRDELRHDDADVTLLLWTLQFLPSTVWVDVLERTWRHAARDGLLLVAAKTRLADARWQEIGDGALADWKWQHGVTADEAADKARSLRGAMNVVTVGRLFDDIASSGWRHPTVLFRWHAWVIIGAWRTPLSET